MDNVENSIINYYRYKKDLSEKDYYDLFWKDIFEYFNISSDYFKFQTKIIEKYANNLGPRGKVYKIDVFIPDYLIVEHKTKFNNNKDKQSAMNQAIKYLDLLQHNKNDIYKLHSTSVKYLITCDFFSFQILNIESNSYQEMSIELFLNKDNTVMQNILSGISENSTKIIKYNKTDIEICDESYKIYKKELKDEYTKFTNEINYKRDI